MIAESLVPAEKLSDYGEITTQLDTLKKHERELLLVYKEAHPLVQTCARPDGQRFRSRKPSWSKPSPR